MLKIGEFSKLSRVSVRMLRHYDEIGLLKPAEIDRFTDYRYYREDQLPIAGRIAALKDMGFSLADIVRILEVYGDREKLDQFFSASGGDCRKLHLPGKLHSDHGCLCCGDRMDGSERRRACWADVQYLPGKPARDTEPR